MELMSQIPAAVLKTPGKPSENGSSKTEDEQGNEAVSFPTILQENRTISPKGGKDHLPTLTAEQVAPTLPGIVATLELSAQCITPENVAPEKALEDQVLKIVSAMAESGNQTQLNPGTPNVGGIPVAAQVNPVQVNPVQTKPVPQEQVSANPSPVILSEPALEEETLAPKIPITPGNTVSPTKAPVPLRETAPPGAKAEVADTKVQEVGKTVVSPKMESPELVASLKQSTAFEIREPVDSGSAIPVEKVSCDNPGGGEQNSDSSWESRQFQGTASAELEKLSVQAVAEKSYQQPAAAVESGQPQSPTLADLKIETGSLESMEKVDQDVTRILASTRSGTASLKRNISGQVLQKVVDHLQEEMGKEKLTIRLNPEKLGQVEVLFKAQGDNLSIVMTAGGREAEQALQEGVRELSESIADKSPRWNLVEIRVDNRTSETSKQETRNDERREKQGQNEKQENQGRREQNKSNQNAGAGEWAAFHLGG